MTGFLPLTVLLHQHACYCSGPLTRWMTMQAPELCTLPLQNHLPVFMHLTTLSGLWVPQ